MADKKEEQKKEDPKNEGTQSSGKTDAEVQQENLRKYEVGGENEGKNWTGDKTTYSGRYRSVGEENYKKSDSYTFKGGFYYDAQLEDPYLSISLHANTKIIDGKWEKWPGPHLEPIGNTGEWGQCYGTDPIARCIFSEDLGYSITNNFSDYNGGNPIEGIFEAMKPYAPILGNFSTNLKDAANETISKNGLGSSIVGTFAHVANKAADVMKAGSGYLNKALYVQGTRFTYYNGTQFNFNNMEMKFIVFSDYVDSGGGEWVFQSVEDYIKRLQPYVMGIYSPYNAEFLESSGFQGQAKDFIKEYVGFQDPPGGFEMHTKALDNDLKGTLRMNIGGTWAIENLVIKGMNVTMSRVQAKDPINAGQTVPLYADISLQLAPASAIVDTGYSNILNHKGMGKLREAISTGYAEKLRELKQAYNKN